MTDRLFVVTMQLGGTTYFVPETIGGSDFFLPTEFLALARAKKYHRTAKVHELVHKLTVCTEHITKQEITRHDRTL